MFSHLTTLLGTNVGLSSWTSALAAPVLGSAGEGFFGLGFETTPAVSYDNVPVGDLKGRRLGIQGHRGAQGVRTEASLYAFAYAIELGVDTLEMDLLFTKDEVPIIWHDHSLNADKCTGPYVGHFIANLTLEQVKSMDCGLQIVEHPEQQVHPLTRVATLAEVLSFINCYSTPHTYINVETKLDPRYPNETFGPQIYVDKIIPIIEEYGFQNRTLIQSFDFRTLFAFRDRWPEYPLVALTDPVTIAQDEDGSFPWLGGIQLDDDEFRGDWVLASYATGAKILGPWFGNGTSVNDDDYEPFTTQAIVDRAHELGMEVHPWTVDDVDTISRMLDYGCEEIVSNYPERVVDIGRRRGMQLGRRGQEVGFGMQGRRRRDECLVNIDWVGPVANLNGEVLKKVEL